MILGSKIDVILLKLAVIVSVLSQINEIEVIFRPLMYLLWICLLLYLLFIYKFKLSLSHFTIYFIIIYILFTLLCICGSFLGLDHLNNNYLKILRIPLLVSIIGGLMKNSLSNEEMKSTIHLFILSSLIFAIWIHITYFRSFSDWMSSNIYLFEQKNSAAQIWSMSVLFLVFQVRPETKWQKVIKFIVIFYLILILGLSQCRTALLGIGGALLFVYSKRLKHPYIVFLCILIICGVLYMIPAIKQTIDHMFLLDKYSGADINTISSGRLEGISLSLEYFLSSPVLGVGNWYIDCSYISVLTESGVLGFILIESVWFYRIILNVFNKSKTYKLIIQAATVFYIVESLLEGYPPFGPGVSSFMFWLVSNIGYFDNEIRKL